MSSDEAGRTASPPYRPIADYAAIGDTHSIALVSRGGSIDWLCWPRFDSPSLFARMLDHQRGGFFEIAPAGSFRTTRRYVEATNVLETTFTTGSGVMRLTDLMPVTAEEEKRHRLSPFRSLLRRVEGIDGEVQVRVSFAPRPGYGRSTIRLESRGDCVCAVDRAAVLTLRSSAPFEIRDDAASATFVLRAGDKHHFALAFEWGTPAVLPSIGSDADRQIEKSIELWRSWSSQLTYT